MKLNDLESQPKIPLRAQRNLQRGFLESREKKQGIYSNDKVP
jgi:hypothetical protein